MQHWQRRNWVEQQRLLEREREYKSLQDLFDEMSALAGKRQHRMMRLALAIKSNDDELVRKRLAEYDESLVNWNEHLNAMYSRFTMLVGYAHTRKLERIQGLFANTGRKLEECAARRLAGGPGCDCSNTVIAPLNSLQGTIGAFQKGILRFIADKKSEIYKEEKISPENLDRLPTWKLFKALFEPRI